MKRLTFFLAIILGAAPLRAQEPASTSTSDPYEGWTLDWAEEFDGTVPNPEIWVRTERGTADWAKTQSKDPRLVTMRDGMLVLRGIVNDNLEADPSPYICGGVTTKDTKGFAPGRIEVRARFQSAKGAWPAIWLLPFERNEANRWPYGGEIDLMEHLNHDTIVYQTVHSPYTYLQGHTDYPVASVHPSFDPTAFNVYGVDVYPDSLVMRLNGVPTNVYPRLPEVEGQYPYYQPMYLLLDMQLEGNWVGKADPSELPVEMEIDWVRHYLPAKP